MAKIVILFKDKNTGKWEKAIAEDKEEEKIIKALHADESPFVKRYCTIGRGVKTSFDSQEEAKSAKQEGDIVQVMAPDSCFSDKSEDTEFYYSDKGEEEEGCEELPIADEEMTGFTED